MYAAVTHKMTETRSPRGDGLSLIPFQLWIGSFAVRTQPTQLLVRRPLVSMDSMVLYLLMYCCLRVALVLTVSLFRSFAYDFTNFIVFVCGAQHL